LNRLRRYDLVVLGGGTAGLVASTTAAGLGARVVLVEEAEQPGGDCLFTGCVPSKSLIASASLAHRMRTAERLGLARAEPSIDLARVIQRTREVIEQAGARDTVAALESQGVEVVRATGRFVRPGIVEAGEIPGGAGVLVTGKSRVEFDRLLVALGRTPRTGGLGPENVGVELDGAGAVRVDARLRTTGDRIWAAGDVTGALYFTHVAGYHGLVGAANALFHARRSVDHSAIPWVTFTDPEVARVGLTERQARERLGVDPLVFRHDYADSDRALTAGEAHGFAKLVCDGRGRLLGATVVAPAAGESIAEVARLVREHEKVAALSQQVHAYPTFSEGPARAADEWWRHKYLNPRGRRRLAPLLALLRATDRVRGW